MIEPQSNAFSSAEINESSTAEENEQQRVPWQSMVDLTSVGIEQPTDEEPSNSLNGGELVQDIQPGSNSNQSPSQADVEVIEGPAEQTSQHVQLPISGTTDQQADYWERNVQYRHFANGLASAGHYFDENGFARVTMNLAQAIQHRTRVRRLPWRNPESEDAENINHVLKHRLNYTQRMIQAVWNIWDCCEDPNSSDAHCFTLGSDTCFSPADVEAGCHILFFHVIDTSNNGFRGFLSDDRSIGTIAFEVDRSATCIERIERVIHCLQKSKSVCREIMQSDRYMILLANHPKWYLFQKAKNKRVTDVNGNSARYLRSKKDARLDPPNIALEPGQITQIENNSSHMSNVDWTSLPPLPVPNMAGYLLTQLSLPGGSLDYGIDEIPIEQSASQGDLFEMHLREELLRFNSQTICPWSNTPNLGELSQEETANAFEANSNSEKHRIS